MKPGRSCYSIRDMPRWSSLLIEEEIVVVSGKRWVNLKRVPQWQKSVEMMKRVEGSLKYLAKIFP